MKLSIIIPVYLVEATLNRCIQSVVSQLFADFELLLIDDGSPDSCPQMCDDWAGKDRRIKVVHQPNGGLSAARNTGLDMAQGDYVTFIDSDDYLAEGTLEALMNRMAGNDMLEYPIWQFYGSSRQKLLTWDDHIYNDINDYWLNGQAYLHTYACNKVFRRELFDGLRFPVGRVFEDFYMLPQLLRRCRQIATTSQGLYYYCWNGQGITANANGQQLRQLLEAHLTAQMPIDDRYYLHLLNIQMDVYELTGDEPRLKFRRTKPVGNIKQKTKLITLNLLGIKGICKLNKTIHKLRRS